MSEQTKSQTKISRDSSCADVERAITDTIWNAWARTNGIQIEITHETAGRKWRDIASGVEDTGALSFLRYTNPEYRNDINGLIDKACYIVNEWAPEHAEEQPEHKPQALANLDAPQNPEDIRSIQAYFASLQAPERLTPCMKRLYSDTLFGETIRDLDPFGMRSYAPLACICAYGMARLARYEIDSHSNPKIINFVAKSGGGKDWILGTHLRSKSLYKHLLKEPEICAEYSSNASVTGNGLSLEAFRWAAAESENGAPRARVCFRPEFGNSATRGYGSDERAGSIANYDISLDYGEIKKPCTKGDLKDLKDFKSSYPYMGIEIRAYQDSNGAKSLRTRYASGCGEGRRELSFWISNPTEHAACKDEYAPIWEQALKSSAFTTGGCERAFTRLSKAALQAVPVAAQYDEEPRSEIKIDTLCAHYMDVYRELLKTVQNAYFRADKCALIRDRLQFLTAISAGLHGRIAAAEDDYWIAGAIVEALANSMDAIMEAEGAVDDTSSIKRKIVERVESSGIRGVRDDKLSYDRKALDELCGAHFDKEGNVYFDLDAPLIYRLNPQRHRVYFAAQYAKQIDQERPELRSPVFNAAYGDTPKPTAPKPKSLTGFI